MSGRTQRQQTDGMIGEYPPNWAEIAKQVKDEAEWKCERCGHPHDPANGYMLTTAHMIPDKANVERWNLAALCQRCHLRIQGKVDFTQPWMFEHSPWMQKHVDAYERAMKELPK